MGDDAVIWSEERVELAKKLWMEGLSASEIAARLRCGTRNAVIGKLYREGLLGAQTPRARRKSRPRMRRAPEANHRAPKQQMTRVEKALARLPTSPIPGPHADDMGRIHIRDVTDSQCKFIPFDDHMCCGLEAVPGLPYCPSHAARCYTTPQRHARVTEPVREEVSA